MSLVQLAWGGLNVTLSGSIPRAWATYSLFLLKGGFLTEKCTPAELLQTLPSGAHCAAQDRRIASLLAVYYAAWSGGGFFAGMFIDTYGPRMCAAVGQVVTIVSTVLIGFYLHNAFFVAILLFFQGLFCNFTFYALFMLSDYWPNHAAWINNYAAAMMYVGGCVPSLFLYVLDRHPSWGVPRILAYYGAFVMIPIGILFVCHLPIYRPLLKPLATITEAHSIALNPAHRHLRTHTHSHAHSRLCSCGPFTRSHTLHTAASHSRPSHSRVTSRKSHVNEGFQHKGGAQDGIQDGIEDGIEDGMRDCIEEGPEEDMERGPRGDLNGRVFESHRFWRVPSFSSKATPKSRDHADPRSPRSPPHPLSPGTPNSLLPSSDGRTHSEERKELDDGRGSEEDKRSHRSPLTSKSRTPLHPQATASAESTPLPFALVVLGNQSKSDLTLALRKRGEEEAKLLSDKSMCLETAMAQSSAGRQNTGAESALTRRDHGLSQGPGSRGSNSPRAFFVDLLKPLASHDGENSGVALHSGSRSFISTAFGLRGRGLPEGGRAFDDHLFASDETLAAQSPQLGRCIGDREWEGEGEGNGRRGLNGNRGENCPPSQASSLREALLQSHGSFEIPFVETQAADAVIVEARRQTSSEKDRDGDRNGDKSEHKGKESGTESQFTVERKCDQVYSYGLNAGDKSPLLRSAASPTHTGFGAHTALHTHTGFHASFHTDSPLAAQGYEELSALEAEHILQSKRFELEVRELPAAAVPFPSAAVAQSARLHAPSDRAASSPVWDTLFKYPECLIYWSIVFSSSVSSLQHIYYPSVLRNIGGEDLARFVGLFMAAQAIFAISFGWVAVRMTSGGMMILVLMITSAFYFIAAVAEGSSKWQYVAATLFVISNSVVYSPRYSACRVFLPSRCLGVMTGSVGAWQGGLELANVIIAKSENYKFWCWAMLVAGLLCLPANYMLLVRENKLKTNADATVTEIISKFSALSRRHPPSELDNEESANICENTSMSEMSHQ